MKKSVNIPKQLFRTAVFEPSAINEEERTVEMSIASDAPYERSFGFEILDHSPGAIDMARMESGAPLLFNHDRDAHIGRIISATTDGKALRIKAKFGNSQLAQEKWQDVKDGILCETSVGYCVNEMILEREASDGPDTYRVTSWLPYEGSLVTIPADSSVGVGRALESTEKREINVQFDNKPNSVIPVNHSTKTMDETPTIDIAAENKKALDAERLRVKKINDFASSIKVDGMKSKVADLARQAIENGADFDSFRTSVLDNWQGATRVETPSAEIGMSSKELKSYSLAKAIYARYQGKPLEGLEKEASDAQAKLLRKDPDGFFIPEDWSSRSLGDIHGMNIAQRDAMQRSLTAGNFTSAGALIGTDLLGGSLIELLRNKTVMLSLGVTSLGGLVGNVAIPRQSGGATAYWLAEGSSVTASDQQFQQLALTPKRLSAATGYDKQLLAQASVSVEAIVRNDIALVMALKKDLAMINGLGAAGEPQGILNQASVGTVTFGAAPTWAKVVSFETTLATANADQTGTPVWVTTPAVRGAWKTTAKIGSTFPIYLWDGDMVNGYKAYVTNQVPSDKVLFGVPSELIDATWAGIDVVVDPYSLSTSAQIRTVVNMWTDLALRHGPAWVVSTDAGNQ